MRTEVELTVDAPRQEVWRGVSDIENSADTIQPRLEMVFEAEAQTMMARVMSIVFRPLMTRSLRKAIRQDLLDLKAAAERGRAAPKE